MRTASIPARVAAPRLRSKRLLAFAGDDRLVGQIRRGNEAAFEVAFERYGAGILGFCRHMLGSPEEAEDVLQHTFAAAFRELRRDDRREVALKPWLYAIARNRCVSLLRARREHASAEVDVATAGLAEEVERRAELRELLRDLLELPEEQREALLLSEAGDLSHADVAEILGCRAAKVKALVFRARSGLIQRREARETPCEEIREQLANLRGGALRRSSLHHHLRACAGCRAYRDAVGRQRRMLAAALPVAPSLALKSSVLGAVGLGGGSAGSGLAAGLAGLGASASAPLGGATAAKVALVGILAAGGAVAGKATLDDGSRERGGEPGAAAVAPQARIGTRDASGATPVPGGADGGAPERARGGPVRAEPSARAGETEGRPSLRPRAPANAGTTPPGQGRAVGGRRRGHAKRKAYPGRAAPKVHGRVRAPRATGRGPIEAPPAVAPVRRGPPEPKPAAGRPPAAKPPPAQTAGPPGQAGKPASGPPAGPVLPPGQERKAAGGAAVPGG